ncbi:MAG TPA: heat-inducible transcriptional repressor HrcA [Candidatus Kapabacteria bacterium]|jgi:heat-inducible transcriptional repressor
MKDDTFRRDITRLNSAHAELTERQREILRLIVRHYVLTANPVGSRYLARYSSLGLSDASMRNIMADLEFMGYIDHPHTSAGRMPTDKGYRLYVNDLMAPETISPAERKAVARSLAEAVTTDDVLEASSNILAKLSRQLSIALLPALDEGILERVEIVPLSSSRVLVVLAASSGRVKTVTLETEHTLPQSKLDELRIMLNERLSGHSFREIKTTFRERMSDLSDHDRSILRLFIDAPDKLFDHSGSDRVKINGAKNIFSQPEFQGKDVTRDEEFQSIIELIDNEEVVIHVLERSGSEVPISNGGLSIRIGTELEERNMTSYSLVCTKYQIGGERGIIGLIGPKRMDYERVAPLVDYVARAMSGVLSTK